jgi:hypothetical protein
LDVISLAPHLTLPSVTPRVRQRFQLCRLALNGDAGYSDDLV